MSPSDPFDQRRMKIFPDAEVVNGAVVTRSILPFHETAQNPPILLETALKQGPEQPNESLYPLVLYIARVAGSNNIILSNLKPGHNSVTRTDVENSLYFVQQLDPTEPLLAVTSPIDVDSPASTRPSSIQDSKGSPVKSEFLPPPPLQEHPIFRQTSQSADYAPASPAPSWNSAVATAPSPSQLPPPPIVTGIRRKPVPPDLETRQLSTLSALDSPLATKKPDLETDARPPVSLYLREIMESGARRRGVASNTPSESCTSGPSRISMPSSPPLLQSESSSPRSPTRFHFFSSRPKSSGCPSSSNVYLSAHGYPTPQNTPSPSVSPRNSMLPAINTNINGTVTLPQPMGMSLRLVRWHNTTSQIWPVAHLVSAPLAPTTKEMRRKSLGASTTTTIPPLRIILDNPGYAPFAATPSQVFHQRADRTNLPMLVRDVDMNYEKSWTKRLLRHSRGKKSESSSCNGHSRGYSHNSISDEDASVNLTAGPGLKKEGYTFITPWDTRCFFRTGKAGTSLVCYHAVPIQQSRAHSRLHSHSRNSMASSFGSPEKEEKRRFREIPVSELRFNLPAMSLFGTPSGENRSHFSIAQETPNRLGREKAGGGRHGDHAKMGKLIIFEGGKDMVDLVVAANVGIWWRSWESAH